MVSAAGVNLLDGIGGRKMLWWWRRRQQRQRRQWQQQRRRRRYDSGRTPRQNFAECCAPPPHMKDQFIWFVIL
jgi:hypothetical protein